MKIQEFMNSKGSLSVKDKAILNSNEALKNSPSVKDFEYRNAGFKVDIDTLTGIKQRVVSQKFYEIPFADYVPTVVGENAFTDQILTWRDFSIGADFESGILESGSNSGRMATADTNIDSVIVPVKDWGFETKYNLIELAKASQSGNWSLVESKEKARVKAWQLGLQKVAFLGMVTDSNVKGLLTQSDVTSNTAVITKNISSMNATEFQAFLAGILPAYFSNANSTVLPNMFVIPTDDFLGLTTSVDETYPLQSRLERIETAMKQATGDANFKVLSAAYAQKERNSDFLGSGSGLNRYSLYRYDEDSLRMDIPVDYTTTIQDTINGFQYQSVGYGEFTGAKAYRPKEMLYFDHSA